MNAFQKQLMLDNKCMAELAGQDRNGVGRAVPPGECRRVPTLPNSDSRVEGQAQKGVIQIKG